MYPNQNPPPAFNPAYPPPFDPNDPPPPYPGLLYTTPSQPEYPNLFPNPLVIPPQPYFPNAYQPFAHAGSGAFTPGYPTIIPQPHVNVSPVSVPRNHIPPGTFPAGYPGNYTASGTLPVGSPGSSHTKQVSTSKEKEALAVQTKVSEQPKGKVEHVIKPTTGELREKKLKIGYCASLNQYIRPTDHRDITLGWRSLIYEERNIMYKRENDTKMAYLARVPKTENARIEWRFDFSKTGCAVKSIKIKFPTQTLNTGNVQASLITNNSRLEINYNKEASKFDNLRGVHSFSIIAELCGGVGNDAWQHAQLFRQPLLDEQNCFEVTVTLQNN